MKTKRSWRARFNYWFDEHISQGVTQQFLLLFGFILSVMIIIGALAAFFHATHLIRSMWQHWRE